MKLFKTCIGSIRMTNKCILETCTEKKTLSVIAVINSRPPFCECNSE